MKKFVVIVESKNQPGNLASDINHQINLKEESTLIDIQYTTCQSDNDIYYSALLMFRPKRKRAND